MLACNDLHRAFGDRLAVDGVSFDIAPGEIYGLLGPNGAGKTTTIRMICGLLRPDGGTIEIEGVSPWDDIGVKRRVGYVPQDVALYPDLTARENLRFVGRLYHLRGTSLDQGVDGALELVGLADRANDRVDAFSGGMKRRLNIAAGLVHRPSLLVLDEPTVGVDPQSRHAIIEGVRSAGQFGMAVLYTTHYMEEAERVCDRVGIIDHGHLVAEGTHRQLVSRLGERDRIELSGSGQLAAFAEACRALPSVEAVSVDGDEVQLIAAEGRHLLPTVLELARRHGASIASVQVIEPDLEAVFLHLTGTALRE